MAPLDFIPLLRTELERFSTLAREVDHTAPISHVPGWTARHVIGHMTGDLRWASAAIETRRAPGFGINIGRLKGDRLVDAFDEEAARHLALIAAAAANPSVPCWNFAEAERGTFGWWVRHQHHETSLHRWDLESPTGQHEPIVAAVATDAVDELLHVYTARYSGQRLDRPITFGCSDTGGAWTITPTSRGRVTVSPLATPAQSGAAQPILSPDVVDLHTLEQHVVAPAADLLLLLWHRLPVDHPTIEWRAEADSARRFVAGPLTA